MLAVTFAVFSRSSSACPDSVTVSMRHAARCSTVVAVWRQARNELFVAVGQNRGVPPCRVSNPNQTIALGPRQRFQQRRGDEADHCRERADTERGGQDGGGEIAR